MKPFRFQKFIVNQSPYVFRVGTDAVLLGAMAGNRSEPNYRAETILEIGCGTGIISLMLAQRFPNAKLLGLDIAPEAANLAAENFSNSPFSERMKSVCADFKYFNSYEKFDLIISNPPYFAENTSEKDKLARQTVELNFVELIQNSVKFLMPKGIFSVIIPAESANYFIEKSECEGLHIVTKINIFGIEGGVLRRVILEFCFEKPNQVLEEIMTIEKSPRQYSYEYLELTNDFHVFHLK